MIKNKLKQILPTVQKPARYIGGERLSVVKEFDEMDINFAFCFPDTYEIGMSHLGLKVLYEILNAEQNIWCQRVFMPLDDMCEQMKANGIKLFSLEGKQSLDLFDIVGFTLQSELTYTNILAMLDMSGIPFYSKERDENHPILVAGGPCACNPEPLADFFDLFILGEGERVNTKICQELNKAKIEGLSRNETLKKLSEIEGVYVPSLYLVDYNSDGTVGAVIPCDNAPLPIKKAWLKDFSSFPAPSEFTVPMIGAVHDRAQIEILRGCVRGCRFCQAGYIYRPFRERSVDDLCSTARQICEKTGYDEISLTSLSSSDYTELEPLLDGLLNWTQSEKINLSLPSLRVDNFSAGLAEKISRVRKSGLTFAPEAGTQRLRDVINKNVTEHELLTTVTTAFESGYSSVKLYFMMGLPTETDEDIVGIAKLAHRVIDYFYKAQNRPKGKGVTVSVSVACFVPKPNTPFERVAQDGYDELRRKQKLLLSEVKTRKISVSYHDADVSMLEAALARGDRRLAPVIESAYRLGCRMDGWQEHFNNELWQQAFSQNDLAPSFYAARVREDNEVLPWEHLDYGVSREFLKREFQNALEERTTQPCNNSCAGCGLKKKVEGVNCVCNKA